MPEGDPGACADTLPSASGELDGSGGSSEGGSGGSSGGGTTEGAAGGESGGTGASVDAGTSSNDGESTGGSGGEAGAAGHPGDGVGGVTSGEGGLGATSTPTSSTATTGSSGATQTSGGGATSSSGATQTSGGGTTSTSGAAETTGGGTSGTGGAEPCSPSGCEPEILTERQLGSVCHDTEIRIEFEARCACDEEGAARTLSWSSASVPGLTLDGDTGVLTGLAEPGHYEFDVAVGIDTSFSTHSTFELTVWDRCFAFLLSDDDEARPQVLAARLDGDESEVVPRLLGDTAGVSAFDLSSDGKYLAQVEVLGDEEKLSLFRVSSDDLEAVDLDHTGNHKQHAFSRDNHWLAILTTNPGDDATSLLQLVDLTATPAVLLDAVPIAHVAGLTWSDVDGILYLSPYDDISDTVREQLVDDDGFGDETIYWSTLADLDPLVAFLVSDSGFFTLRRARATYRDRDEDSVRQLDYPDWLSPSLGWMTVDLASGMRLEPMYQAALLELPYATAPDCHTISAWSADDSTFVCTRTEVPVVYETGIEGTLYGTEIPLPDGLRPPTSRMALSEHGNWFAFVPTEDGLVVLPAEDYEDAEIDGAMLEAPSSGTNEWDFFFTRDERKLIVQRGRDLVVGTLDPALAPVFTLVAIDANLNAVRECLFATYPTPADWCGAPRFAGNLDISRQETHISVIDEDDNVHVVDLATLHPRQLGHISQSCSRDCVRFQ